MEGNTIEPITKYASSKRNLDEVFRKVKTFDLTSEEDKNKVMSWFKGE